MTRSKWLRRSRTTLFALAMPWLATSADAAEGVTVKARTAREARSAWTAQRLREARPLPMQQVFDAVAAAEALTFADDAATAAAGDSFPGARPVAGLQPVARRLFTPRLDAVADAAVAVEEPAKGTANGFFTSQRLIPAEADLQYPYRTTGVLFFNVPGEGDFFCSAAAIGRRLVVTAGQCVHQGFGGSNGFFDDFVFVPAFRSGTAPLGQWEWEYVAAPSAWTTGGGNLPNAADYAIIEVGDLVCQGGVVCKLGDVTGFLGFQVNKLRPNHAHMLGYALNFDNASRMHQVTAQALRAASNNTVEYGGDMRAGAAGGPVIQDFGDNAKLAKWIGALSWTNNNAGVKTQGISIPDSRFTQIRSLACQHRSGNC